MRVNQVDTADFVIVGAGSAGSVLANRLSANTQNKVLVLEAGPKDNQAMINIPLGLVGLMGSAKFNWRYMSTPQSHLDGREIYLPRGKTLGGSSSVNGMIYIRGHRNDYDKWANDGATGWSYDDVLPFFKRGECSLEGLSSEFHGQDGEWPVGRLAIPNPMDNVFAEAANNLQIPSNNDFNGATQEGVGVFNTVIKNGRRFSTARAFLDPVKNRSNLEIRTECMIEKLIVFEGRVTGLRYRDKNNQIKVVTARREVILSAGAFGSPNILMQSGIGPGAHLCDNGIEVHHDLQGVGQNLQDHVDTLLCYHTNNILPYGISFRALPRLALNVLEYATKKTGLLASNMVEAGGFVRTSRDLSQPDIQFHFIPGRRSHKGKAVEWGHGFALHTCLLQPKSRGEVLLSGRDPYAQPVINPNFLSAPEDLDKLLAGIKLGRKILQGQPFERFQPTEVVPGPDAKSDEQLRNVIRTNAATVFHPVGTCKMGQGADAVVDAQLKVHGLQGLRVADASIMPTIVSGNTSAPSAMIGEKAADMILSEK